MRKLILIIIFFLICSFAVIGQTADPEDLQTLNKVGQEHQNTRKYFSNELTRQRTEFFKMFDDRANYYEETFDDMITKTVIKLALLWGGIMLFFTSFNNFLRNRIEKRRYKKLKQDVVNEVVQSLGNTRPVSETKPVQQEVVKGETGYVVEAETLLRNVPKPQETMKPTMQPTKPLSKRKEKKAYKQLKKIDEGIKFFQKEKEQIQRGLGITPVGTNKTDIIYEEGVEVDY